MKFTHPLALACAALALAACGGDTTTTDLGMPLDGGSDTGMPVDAGRDLSVPDAGPGVDGGTDISSLPTAQHAANVADCACDPASRGFATSADCVMGLDGPAAAATCDQVGATAAPVDVADYFRCRAVAFDNYATCLTAVAPMCDAAGIGDCGTNLNNDLDGCTAPATASGNTFAMARGTCIASMVTGTTADSCSDTAAASMMVGADVFHGTTLGAGDHRDGSCITGTGSGGAPDVALRWTAPAAGTYTIDTLGSLFDTALYVLDGCGASATELACNDDIDGGAGNYRSTVDVTLTAGQTIQIIVDGYDDAAAGDYHVNITGGGTTTDGGVMDAGTADAGVADGGSADAATD